MLLIARFTISFQRRRAPLSKTVLERQTGLSGPGVLQAVSNLLAKGLIEKIPGDQHRPNQLGLVFSEDWDFFPTPSSTRGSNASVSGVTRVTSATPVATETPAPVAAVTPAEASAVTDFKDSSTIEKNSLSQHPKIHAYFTELKPAKKRESEWRAFISLQADYSDQDIADCLGLLVERGIGTGESTQPCHSPMAFLSKAIGAVLPEATAKRRKSSERLERERREAETQRLRVEDEAREIAIAAEKERAFENEFPSREQQLEVLTELLRGLPFGPTSQPGRILGIGRWWELHQSERTTLQTEYQLEKTRITHTH